MNKILKALKKGFVAYNDDEHFLCFDIKINSDDFYIVKEWLNNDK